MRLRPFALRKAFPLLGARHASTKAATDQAISLNLQLQRPRSICPRVLIVGDGNFSYAKALVSHLQDASELSLVSITASSLDTREELIQMYPEALQNVEQLQNHGVRVCHGVNATKLASHTDDLGGGLFDRIVFNFPHFAEGGNKRNKISKHRELLDRFFISCNDVLAPQGQVWLALCAGQGGTLAESVVRSYGDTWQVVDRAANGQFLLLDVKPFPVDALAARGYKSVGYLLADRSFHSEQGLVHIFGKEGCSEYTSRFPQTWTRDVSLWLEQNYSVATVQSCFDQVFGSHVSLALTQRDEYFCAKTNRHSAMFQVTIKSSQHNFTRKRLNEYIRLVGVALKEREVGEIRT